MGSIVIKDGICSCCDDSLMKDHRCLSSHTWTWSNTFHRYKSTPSTPSTKSCLLTYPNGVPTRQIRVRILLKMEEAVSITPSLSHIKRTISYEAQYHIKLNNHRSGCKTTYTPKQRFLSGFKWVSEPLRPPQRVRKQ